MTSVIEIQVPYEEIKAREERVLTAKRFEQPDRTPVIPAINYRFLLPKIGVRFQDYYNDPEVMLRSQILGQKWLMENVQTDAYSITGAWVGGWTDFQNTTEPSALGCPVMYPENDIPVVDESGWVRNDADLRRLEKIDFINNGLNGKQIEFRQKMIKVADKYPVCFHGGPIFYPGANPALTHTSHGPFTVSASLTGAVEMFTAMLERPDFAGELMDIVTTKIIQWLDFCWEEEKLPDRSFAWTDDLSAYLSADVWERVLLPHDLRLRQHFDWASMHMCGQTNHLLDIFTNKLKINELQGFSYQVNLDRIAQIMGGKVVLLGNVSPMLIASGTPEQVKIATIKVLEKLAHCGGLIIQDGNNIAPETPIENINAMMAASKAYGQG
jgi:uroporphyrinogen-III decarboxylase